MKILVASDSHHNTDTLSELTEQYPNMDRYLFAGDSEDCPSNLYPFDAVQGNCDYFDFDEKRFIRLKNINILMKHHPSLTNEEIKDTKIFIHGHTHIYKIEEENGLITLCPGAISFSRDNSNGSYAIIEVNDNKIVIKIHSLETKKVLLQKSFIIK